MKYICTVCGFEYDEEVGYPEAELEIIKAYDAWKEKKLYGKNAFGVVRCTYIINESGMIEKAMPKVKPDTNAAEILEYLEK